MRAKRTNLKITYPVGEFGRSIEDDAADAHAMEEQGIVNHPENGSMVHEDGVVKGVACHGKIDANRESKETGD